MPDYIGEKYIAKKNKKILDKIKRWEYNVIQI